MDHMRISGTEPSSVILSQKITGSKQKRSTEGCSKFKEPETRQVQERLVSTLEHMQVPKWDRTRCPEEYASSVGMPHPLHMFYRHLTQLGKKSNSVIRS